MKKTVTIVFLALFCIIISTHAQSEQTYKPCVMQITQEGKTKSYILETFSYNLNHQPADSASQAADLQYLSLSVTLGSLSDKELDEWIADSKITKSGKIIIRDEKTGKTKREFTFEGAKIEYASESAYGGYNDNLTCSLSLNIICSKFSINAIPIKNLAPNKF